MDMQLKITTPLDSFPKLIEFNFSELQSALQTALADYKGLAYTPETIKTAKSDRATLNKLKKAIEDERRSMRAICLKPYEDFDVKTKQLIAMIDEPVREIDAQVKRYENEQRDIRKLELQAFYYEEAGEIAEQIPYCDIHQEKWTNATASKKAVEEQIRAIVNEFKQSINTIETTCGEFVFACKAIYFKTRNLSEAMNEKVRLEAIKARDLEKQKEQEQLKPEPDVNPEEQPKPEVKADEIPLTADRKIPNEMSEPAVYTLAFRVHATRKQLMALKQFLNDNAIEFERA